MATYATDSYVLKFSQNYEKLEVFTSGENPVLEEDFDLANELKVWIKDGDYVLEQEDYGDAFEQSFFPVQFPQSELQVPLRFVGNDFIGSTDLRDQRTGYDNYLYHLTKCAITLQFRYESYREIVVRTKCDGEGCTSAEVGCMSSKRI